MPAMVAVILQLGGCAVIVVCAAAATVYSLRPRTVHGRGGRADSVFWNLFLGLVVLLPAVLIPAVFHPLAGAAMALLAITAAVATHLGRPAIDVRRRQRRLRRTAAQSFAGAAARHACILSHWQRYELDVARTIDYPSMCDVRQPSTAALMRAMREAELASLTADPDHGGTVTATAYGHAVARLEQLLALAERAAGVPAAEQWLPPVATAPRYVHETRRFDALGAG
ncbi:MAG: hypothetical protein M3017_05495 [Actinomycetota bacterium]|nr:hypothetical protein [Actinomycetota bacterium]